MDYLCKYCFHRAHCINRWVSVSSLFKKKNTIIDDGPANTLVAAVMGLLAFILAFAFSVTTNRFDTRKGLLLEEVNTIETLYMRADLIPEQYQAQVKKILLIM